MKLEATQQLSPFPTRVLIKVFTPIGYGVTILSLGQGEEERSRTHPLHN